MRGAGQPRFGQREILAAREADFSRAARGRRAAPRAAAPPARRAREGRRAGREREAPGGAGVRGWPASRRGNKGTLRPPPRRGHAVLPAAAVAAERPAGHACGARWGAHAPAAPRPEGARARARLGVRGRPFGSVRFRRRALPPGVAAERAPDARVGSAQWHCAAQPDRRGPRYDGGEAVPGYRHRRRLAPRHRKQGELARGGAACVGAPARSGLSRAAQRARALFSPPN